MKEKAPEEFEKVLAYKNNERNFCSLFVEE